MVRTVYYEVRFIVISYKRTNMKSWLKYDLVENRLYVNASVAFTSLTFVLSMA